MKILIEHDWPGNVRELENVIERACVLTKADVIEPEDLPQVRLGAFGAGAAAFEPDVSLPIAEARDAFEKAYVCKILRETKGNISAAAKRAGIAWQNFQRKLKKFDINAKLFSKT